MTTGTVELPVEEGSSFSIGGKEIELERVVPREDYMSGSCFGGVSASSFLVQVSAPVKSALSKQFVPLKLNANSSSRPSGGHEKKVIALQPVDLISASAQYIPKNQEKADAEGSHWTAIWLVVSHPFILSVFYFTTTPGESHKTRRHGMEMLSSHTREIN
jgi:DNA repair and recombination protein RAD54B